MSTLTANVYRTDPAQIACDGEVAFSNMNFGTDTSREAILAYCAELAANNGITSPRIEITDAVTG